MNSQCSDENLEINHKKENNHGGGGGERVQRGPYNQIEMGKIVIHPERVKDSPFEGVKDSPSEEFQLRIWAETVMRQENQLWGDLLDVQGGGKAGKGQ